jgi:hypothetical protein
MDIDIKNHQGRTPYDLRNEPKHKLLALSQQASLLTKQESEFVRRIKELRASYLVELTSQEKGNGIWGALVKKFIDTNLIAERKKTLETLGTLIELAIAECNDAFLAKWVMHLLQAHFNGKFVHLKDSLPINGTDFFQKLAAVYNGIISAKRNDFNAIRLPSNFEQFLLERSVYTQNSKLLEAQAQLAITSEENHRLRTERDEARQKLVQETKLRIEIEQQLEEERKKTTEEMRLIEQKLKENEALRKIAASSIEVPTSSQPRSRSTPASLTVDVGMAPPLGASRHILLSSASATAACIMAAPSPTGGATPVEMQTLSKKDNPVTPTGAPK